MICNWCRSAGEALGAAKEARTPELRAACLEVAGQRHSECPDPACPCHHDLDLDALAVEPGAA